MDADSLDQALEVGADSSANTKDPSCVIRSGEVAIITTKGLILPDGSLRDQKNCSFEKGSTLRLHYEEETTQSFEEEKPMPDTPTPEAVPPTVTASATEPPPAPVLTTATAAVPAAPVAAPVAAPQTELIATTEVPSSDLADVTGAANAATQLGGDYAPIVGLLLAAMAILGGGKAWGYYRERAEQKHALEMEKLKIQSVSPSSRPPSCKQAQVQVDERLDAHEKKISKLERQSLELGDLDGDEVLRRLKKLERRLAEVASDD